MTTQNKNVPALRFPEFNCEWEVKNLSEIANRVTTKNKANKISLVLTNSAIQGIVSQRDYFDKSIANQNNLGGYYIVEKGDFVYNPRISASAPVGPIKRNKLANGLMSPLYSVFRFKSENLDFIEYYFDTSNWHKYMESIANYGARHDRMNITVNNFYAMPIILPTEKEQKKIAAFLTALDEKILQLIKKKDLLEQYKKGVMQKIFNQETRFKDDNGNDFADWKLKKLEDVVISHNSGIYKSASLYGEGTNIIGVSDLYSISSINGQEFDRVPLTDEELSKFTLNEGDLIYGESSLVREGIAKTLFVTKKGAGTAFAWHTRRFKVNNAIVNSSFLYYQLNSSKIRKTIMSVATQTALTGITTKEYFNIKILLPNLKEQTIIANFLSAIDEKINSVNQQLEKTKEYKKGLLQQMFI